MRSSAAAWRLRAVPKFMELNDCWVWKKKLFGSILFSRLLAPLRGTNSSHYKLLVTRYLPSHAGASERAGEIFKLPFSFTYC